MSTEESAILNILPRFRGPDQSGNGGYVCGLLGQHLDGPAEVVLLAPPPLNRDLFIEGDRSGNWVLRGPTQVVAEAKPAKLDLEVPVAITFSEAQEATAQYLGFQSHPYPHCFVCGPSRAGGDGLRIFPGPLPNQPGVAAPWIPDESLADHRHRVAEEFLWAALDCPGAWALLQGGCNPIILGTLIAQIHGSLSPGDNATIRAWPLETQGRKHWVGSALYSETGEIIGRAKAVWIELTPEQMENFKTKT